MKMGAGAALMASAVICLVSYCMLSQIREFIASRLFGSNLIRALADMGMLIFVGSNRGGAPLRVSDDR